VYVELTARTNFSFLRGASPPEAILQRAAALGYDAIGIADCDGLYGMVRALEEAKKHGVRLVVGCELTLDDPATSTPNGALSLYVETHAGYTNLCRILTESHRRHPKGKARAPEVARRDVHGASARNLFAGVPIDFVCEHAEGLWALAHPSIAWPISDRDLAALARAFGDRLSLSVHRHMDGDDRARVAAAVEMSEKHGVAICATNDVRYA